MNTPRNRKDKAVILDIDDTILLFSTFVCFLHNKEYGTSITPNDILDWDFSTLEMRDVRGNIVTGEQLLGTYRKYEDHGLYAALPVIRPAKFALQIMKDLGYKIILLTARKEEYKNQTMLNIIKHEIPFDEIYFEYDKVKKIRQLQKTNNIQLFADDKCSTVVDVNQKCNVNHVCLINMRHNIDEDIDEDIIRINDLLEAVRYLKEL